MKIRTKIGFLAVVLSVSVAAAAAVGFYLAERRTLLRKMEGARTALADHLAQTCRDALVVNDELAALNAAAAVRGNTGVLDAYCLDAKGFVVAHANTAFLGKAPLPIDRVDGILMTVPVTNGPARKAVVVFSKSAMEREVEQSLREVWGRILSAMGGALGLGLLGAWLLALHLTRPIQRIAQGTHRVAAGDLGHRLTENRADELGELARDFNRMAARLGELDQMKRDFVAMVTHELRSPLSAIESYANFLMEELPAQSSRSLENLLVIRNNATRLGRFVNDILDLSKIESRAMDLRLEPVDVAQIFKDLLDLFTPIARERSIQLSAQSPTDLKVSADPDKLNQVLTNLLGNALKFTPRGGKVTLSAEIEKPGETLSVPSRVRLTVSDTGPGIPPADQQRIFDKFEQVRGIRPTVPGAKGTGLGLAIVKGLVEAQGGTVHVESRVGHGSAFSVSLPL